MGLGMRIFIVKMKVRCSGWRFCNALDKKKNRCTMVHNLNVYGVQFTNCLEKSHESKYG